MALTLTPVVRGYIGGGLVMQVYTMTATGSGDTATLSATGGVPFKIEVMDANGNQIISTPPTVGSWSTTAGVSSATLTANAGGVVTNGRLIVLSGGN